MNVATFLDVETYSFAKCRVTFYSVNQALQFFYIVVRLKVNIMHTTQTCQIAIILV